MQWWPEFSFERPFRSMGHLVLVFAWAFTVFSRRMLMQKWPPSFTCAGKFENRDFCTHRPWSVLPLFSDVVITHYAFPCVTSVFVFRGARHVIRAREGGGDILFTRCVSVYTDSRATTTGGSRTRMCLATNSRTTWRTSRWTSSSARSGNVRSWFALDDEDLWVFFSFCTHVSH